ncbi:MAG: metalloregulator ArsR/SmtB family transcription factor [Hyphomonadaceae bacterium]|nr:metalloregulator ArsR/SmtB family transcription factor [Hyphomonadaceae bacterium]
MKQLSALSQETRLLTFRALMEAGSDGMQAGAIAELLGLAPNKLSGHLSILAHSGLVSVQRDGRRMVYRAEIDAVNGMLSYLVETCCHGHPEVCAPLAQLRSESC